jgi:hypothetical protein
MATCIPCNRLQSPERCPIIFIRWLAPQSFHHVSWEKGVGTLMETLHRARAGYGRCLQRWKFNRRHPVRILAGGARVPESDASEYSSLIRPFI